MVLDFIHVCIYFLGLCEAKVILSMGVFLDPLNDRTMVNLFCLPLLLFFDERDGLILSEANFLLMDYNLLTLLEEL